MTNALGVDVARRLRPAQARQAAAGPTDAGAAGSRPGDSPSGHARRLSHRDLSVSWYSTWHPELDEALKSFPEPAVRPHGMMSALARFDTAVPKATALVTHDDVPVAVVPLRRTGRSWEPVTSWSVPGQPFPARVDVLTVTRALRRSVHLAWWRMGASPSLNRRQGRVLTVPTYQADLTGDWEEHWRQTSHWKSVRRARRRCARYTTRVDHPAAVEWIMVNAERAWRSSPNRVDPTFSDRLLATQYLSTVGQVQTVCLLDDGWPIAGSLSIIQDDVLVGLTMYRDRRYDRDGVGVRVMDVELEVSAQRGLRASDFGGGFDYKNRWAPEEGVRADVLVAPTMHQLARQARIAARQQAHAARSVPRRVDMRRLLDRS